MKIRLEFNKHDAWFGVYWNLHNIWICLIPCIPIRIYRRSICYYCNKRIDGDYNEHGWHDKIKNQKYSQYTDELVTCREAWKIDEIVDEDYS